jgi:DNA-damage-inducible protein D
MSDELTGGSDDQAILPLDDGSAGRVIRREWHKGRWFFSVIDVVAILTDSKDPGNYWAVLKRRLAEEGASEVVTNCHRLKLRSPLDGKKYATDAADVETMLRLVQSVPSPKAEPVKQWLAQVGAQRLEDVAASLDEEQRRQLLRGEIADRTATLNDVAKTAGVVTTRDFAIFTDWGYKGLYAGETSRDIATRKGLPKGEHILDWMGSEELAANFFRITQTDAKLRRDGVDNKVDANATHFAVGRAVRKTIEELGGTMPERLPTPPDSIKQVAQREQRRIEQAAERRRQPSLFDESSATDGE